MKKLRISIKEFITFYSINNLNKAKIPIYHAIYNHSTPTSAVNFFLPKASSYAYHIQTLQTLNLSECKQSYKVMLSGNDLSC